MKKYFLANIYILRGDCLGPRNIFFFFSFSGIENNLKQHTLITRVDGQQVPQPSFWRLLANKAKEQEADDDFDCITPVKKFQS